MFTHEHLIPSIHTAQMDSSEGYHFYITDDNKRYPGVTTMLSTIRDKKSLDDWRKKVGEEVAKFISKTAQDNGRKFHKLVEQYLNNEDQECKELLPYAHFMNLKPLLDKITLVRETEIVLFSDNLRLGGTCDCIAVYDGKLSVIDFKTSKKSKKKEWIKDYFLQATAYCVMVKEMFNINIEQIVILMTNEDGSHEAFIEDPNNFKQDLYDAIEKYYSVKK